jgi:hypothetical protein
MFLIQYKEGDFLDAEKISTIYINNKGVVMFCLDGDLEVYTVDKELANIFMNNLQSINSGIQNIEAYYYKRLEGKA